MSLITSLTAKDAVIGSEEIPVNYSGTDYKITPAQITGALETALDAEIATRESEIQDLQNEKLDLTGGTLTGDLVLNADPTESLHPATKQWVEAQLTDKADAIGQSLDSTTTAVTAADTSESTAVATTLYVANKIEYEAFQNTVINNPTHTLTEAEKGTLSVNRTSLSAVAISLPQISALVSEERTHYHIVDTGLNATTNNITITPFAGDTINTEANFVINSDGQSLWLINDGSTNWIIKNKQLTASETVGGVLEIATTTEAEALTLDTKIITPDKLGDVLDATVYNRTEVGTATYTLAESESGLIAVTRSSAGTCTITLPVISTLTTPIRVSYKIVDEGAATTYPITINPGTGNTIGGLSTYKMVTTGEIITLTNNGGTKWFLETEGAALLSGAHAYLSADQTIGNAAWTQVAFNTISALNTLTQFDTATYIFTPSRNQYFLAQATVYFAANATGVRGVRIIETIAAVDYIRAEMIISGYATYDASVTVHAMFGADSSSTISVDVFQTSGGNLDIQGGALTNSHFRIVEK